MNAPYQPPGQYAPPGQGYQPPGQPAQQPQYAPPQSHPTPGQQPAPGQYPGQQPQQGPQAAPQGYQPPTAAALGAQAGYPGAPAATQHQPPQYAPQGQPSQGGPGGAQPGRFKTGLVRMSYFFVLRRDDKGKQRATILIPKSDHQTYQLAQRAEQEAIAKKWPQNPPQYYRRCIKDGDTYVSPTNGKPLGPECRGHWVINSSGSPNDVVRVLDQYGNEITDPRAVNSGDWGRVSLTFYGSSKDNNIGVNAALNSVIFVQKGEPLSQGNVAAEDEFAGDFQAPPPGYVPPQHYQAPQQIGQPGQQPPLQGQAPQPVGGFHQDPGMPQQQPTGQPQQYPQGGQQHYHQPPQGQQPYQPQQQQYGYSAQPTSAPPAPVYDQNTGQWLNPTWNGHSWVVPGQPDIPF